MSGHYTVHNNSPIFVNALKPSTTITSSTTLPLKMMFRNQYKGILKKQYMSLVYNELMGSSLTVNERPRAFPAGVH